jgi:hypothetical protein
MERFNDVPTSSCRPVSLVAWRIVVPQAFTSLTVAPATATPLGLKTFPAIVPVPLAPNTFVQTKAITNRQDRMAINRRMGLGLCELWAAAVPHSTNSLSERLTQDL